MKRFLLIIFSTIIILISTFQIIRQYQANVSSLDMVHKSIGKPMVWRSGVSYLGGNFGDYLTFLNERIPEDVMVILPPKSMGNQFLGHTQIMQFFLTPREVVNCTEIECLKGFLDKDAYILVVEPQIFPGYSADIPNNRIKLMNGKWGFIAPVDHPENYSDALPRFSNIEEFIISIVMPLLWIVLISLIGFFVLRFLFPSWGIISQGIVGVVLSITTFSLFEFILLFSGIPLTIFVIYVLSGYFIFIAIFVGGKYRKSIFVKNFRSKRGFTTLFWEILFLFLGAIALLISVGKGYFSTDGIVIWGSKGYGIASDGLFLGVKEWGTSVSGYPLGIPILIASLKSTFGEILPSSKIIFPIYYLGLVFSLWEFFRSRFKDFWAAIFSLVLITSPIISKHSVIAYANLPFTTIYLISTIMLVQTISQKPDSKLHYVLVGFTQALAMWIRPEGVYLTLSFVLVVFIYLRKKQILEWKPKIISFLLPIMIFIILWSLSSNIIYPNDSGASYTSTAISEIYLGNFRFNDGITIFVSVFKILFTAEEWGYIGFVILFGLVITLYIFRKFDHEASFFLFSGLLVTIFTSGLIYLISFTEQPGCNLNCWIFTGLNRYSMPGIVLIYIGSIYSVFRIGGFGVQLEKIENEIS